MYIQIHGELDASVPDCGRLIYSCADDPEKHKYKKIKSSVHICDNASAREVQPPKEPKMVKSEVAQWMNSVVQENKKQRCQAQIISVFWQEKPRDPVYKASKAPNTYAVSDQLKK